MNDFQCNNCFNGVHNIASYAQRDIFSREPETLEHEDPMP